MGMQVSGYITASDFKSKDSGFSPLAGQGEGQFFYSSESTRVQTCLCLTPLRVYGTHPNLCARLRSHIHHWSVRPHIHHWSVRSHIHHWSVRSHIYTRVGLTAGGMETRKHCTQDGKERKSLCIALGQECYLIKSLGLLSQRQGAIKMPKLLFQSPVMRR